MVQAAGELAIKVAGDLAGPAAEAGGKHIGRFLTDQFDKGKAIPLDINWRMPTYPKNATAKHYFYGSDYPELRALGIEYIGIEKDNGFVYEYTFYINNNKPMKFWFTDYEPDTYKVTCQDNGKHYINFNSNKPGIKTIQIQNT